MPIISAGSFSLEYSDDGSGPPIVLVHSSASGNRQWRRLSESLADRYRCIAVNLFGYGATTAWPAEKPLTLGDQADLIAHVLRLVSEPVVLIGHSLGAAVSLEAAIRLRDRVRALIVYEPILFYLLAAHEFHEAHAEITGVAHAYRTQAARQDWHAVGKLFIDYWSGDGTWSAIPDERKAGPLKMLPNVVHEWDAVLQPGRPLSAWSTITVPTHVIRAADTRAPTYQIASLLTAADSHMQLHEVPVGGHMAPVSRPEIVNPLIAALLDRSNG